ncbi:MAG TPA: phosphate ABC transporter substrate-binding protein PstS [Candidatus Binataceae bacterium]|nr:phosphate ABC transporter substrate-binding protein PstS [Candidatus Binataceae bacterium]
MRPRPLNLFAYLTCALLVTCALFLPGQSRAATELTGAGSTFDYPFFSRAFYQYTQNNPDVTVNYQSIGSGGGIQQFIAKTVDFGASDVPMNAAELQRAGGPVLQIPVTLGGEAICYNLPGIDSGLKFTPDLIADIYLGKVTKWNDPALQKLNPNAKLPDMPIMVVHRSDGSGTTYIFTDFLSTISSEWKQKVGTGKSVSWPAPSSVGGKGNEGVAGQVRQSAGAIGYVELAYVLQNHITYGQLQNKAGAWVSPSIETVAAAAATKPTVSATDFSIVNAAGANSYPISGYSWVMVYQKPADPARAALVKKVLSWLVTDGQEVAKAVSYVPLPQNVQKVALDTLGRMEVGH